MCAALSIDALHTAIGTENAIAKRRSATADKLMCAHDHAPAWCAVTNGRRPAHRLATTLATRIQYGICAMPRGVIATITTLHANAMLMPRSQMTRLPCAPHGCITALFNGKQRCSFKVDRLSAIKVVLALLLALLCGRLLLRLAEPLDERRGRLANLRARVVLLRVPFEDRRLLEKIDVVPAFAMEGKE